VAFLGFGGYDGRIFLQIAGTRKRVFMGLAVSVAELTDKQAAFVRAYLVSADVKQSALAAGYTGDNSGYATLRSPAVQRAIADYGDRLIATEGRTLAYQTLKRLMSATMPPMVQLGAAKAMMSAAGIATAPADKQAEKPLNEMTEAELKAFIERMDKIAAGEPIATITVIPDDSAPNPGTT
jgi:phage terminase small subunit